MLQLSVFRPVVPAFWRASPSFATRHYAPFLAVVILLLSLLNPLASSAQKAKNSPIEVMVVGFDHLNSLYNKQPESDVFSPKKQAELAKLRAQLALFRPEAIMLEAEPREQPQLDSLYERYRV
jgi:hypothetical protein